MKGYERFDALVTVSINNCFRPMIIEMKEAYDNDVVPNKSTHSFAKTFIYGFNEISSSLEAMRLAETFIKSAGSENSPIKNNEYLKYRVHAYLQESYILKNRLEDYAKKLNRAYSKTSRKEILKATEDGLLSCITKAFERIVNARGNHVHTERFNDRDLALSAIFAMGTEKNSEKEDLAQRMFCTAAQKWLTKTTENNRVISDFIDNYFDYLYQAITLDDQLITPEDLRSQNKPSVG